MIKNKNTLVSYCLMLGIAIFLITLLHTNSAEAGWLGEAWESFKGAVSETWDSVKEAASSVIEAIGEAATWIKDEIMAYVNSIITLEPGHVSEFCETFESYKNSYKADDGCWTCQIFILFFDTGNEVASLMSGILKGSAAKLLWCGLLLWLTYHVTCFYSNVANGESILPLLTQIFGGFLRVGICLALVTEGNNLFDYIVNPILSSFANFASAAIGYSCDVSVGEGGGAGPLSGSRKSMVCMVNAIASGLSEPRAVAHALRCGGWHWRALTVNVNPFMDPFQFGPDIPNPIMIGWGMCLQFWYMIIDFMFPLSLLDVVFRLGIILGFVPLLAVAWVFPCTRSYTKTGFELFLHCCMTFLICSMVLGIIVTLIRTSWAAGMPSEFMNDMVANDYVGAFDGVWYSGGYKVVILSQVISFFGIIMAPKPDQISSQFVGASAESQGVAYKAIHYIILFVVDVIILIISILTAGATAELYIYKLFHQSKEIARTAEAIKKAKERKDALEKKIKKIRERQRKLRRLRANVRKAKAAAKTLKK